MKPRFFLFAIIAVVLVMYLFQVDEIVPVALLTSEHIPRIVIDAGHGGEDGGAVAADGTTESFINLSISKRTENVLAFCGVSPIMTRTEEHIDYPDTCATIRSRKRWDQDRRIAIINTEKNTVLVSIHQNFYPSSSPHGIQVLYGSFSGSDLLAKEIHSALIRNLQPDNRRSPALISNTIYLMRKTECPAVLIECGFLSNPSELQLLKTDSYQTKLALIISTSVLLYCCGVTYES